MMRLDLALQEPDSARAELATPSYGRPLPGLVREPASAPGLVLVRPSESQQAWELQQA
jgi:hypothetical protein